MQIHVWLLIMKDEAIPKIRNVCQLNKMGIEISFSIILNKKLWVMPFDNMLKAYINVLS